MRSEDLEVRLARESDRVQLRTFRCSTGEPWEELVEAQIRGPLPSRYLSAPPAFDGRLLIGFGTSGDLLVIGGHRIEPTFVQDVGYIEAVAVARGARGTRVEMPDGEDMSLGYFILATILRQMVRLGRHRRAFARVDRRNSPSLALLSRAGLTDERPDPRDDSLVQRWGELP